MALTRGTRIGPYEIAGSLGVGGMGEVHRATDTRLKREVALKVLPSSVASSPDRLARFQREAEVLAALNHPNIAAIYGLEDSGAETAIVMELVEGPTLAERLIDGRLPLDEALDTARQIAEALEAAHELGIVHRDLKPANIKVRPDGRVKVLDFGLAKAMESSEPPPAANSMAATLTSPAMTQLGMILGTAAYMSPEQARGKQVDRRADIWAFGVVLYEMLSGKPAFADLDVSLTLSRVLQRDPDYTQLPAVVPPRVVRVIELCLRKDARQRAGDIRDVRLALDGAFDSATSALPAVAPPRHDRAAWAVAAVMTAAVVMLSVLYFASRPKPPESLRLSIPVPGGWELSLSRAQGVATSLVLSPDGRSLVMVARQKDGKNTILIRDFFGDPSPRPLASTEGATSVFWRPDSQMIAFFADGELKKVAASGGVPTTLAKVGAAFGGGSWNRDGIIVYSGGPNFRLFRVPDSGGEPIDALPDPSADDPSLSIEIRPTFLPDGRTVLFVSGNEAGTVVWAAPLGSPQRTRVVDTGSTNVQFVNGHLLYLRDGTLVAHPFDPALLKVTGDPLPVAPRVLTQGIQPTGFGMFSASETGALVHMEGSLVTGLTQLGWVDRRGTVIETFGEPDDYRGFALSHDEKRVATPIGFNPSPIFLINLQNRVRTPFTFDPVVNQMPVWSWDDRFLDYAVQDAPSFRKASNGASAPQAAVADEKRRMVPWDRTRDDSLIYSVEGDGSLDLWALPASGMPFPLATSSVTEAEAKVSPNGRWVAYREAVDGIGRLWVIPFSRQDLTAGGRWPVADAGDLVSWRADGRELYYRRADSTLMAMQVAGDEEVFEPGPTTPLFRLHVPAPRTAWPYAASRDGQRFLVLLEADALGDQTAGTRPIHVEFNWTSRILR